MLGYSIIYRRGYKGQQLGQTIGFPTVNIVPDPEKLLPMDGVYETRILIENECYKGVTNVGNRPRS
jgi:riboflavin kinase/FMN adenylyltransferase